MKKGILLIAVGAPYYGKQAYNLAVSLKAADPDIPISIVHDDTALQHLHPACKDIFDQLILVPAKVSGSGIEKAMALRVMLPKLTPYAVTLSLDVDMIWTGKPISPLFDLVSDEAPVTYVNEGYFDMDGNLSDAHKDYLPWASPEVIKEKYSLTGKLYQMRGEFIIFKSCKVVSEVFREAAKIRKNPEVQPAKLAGSVTEEFALNIAINKAGLAPHENRWQPSYWPLLNGGIAESVKEIKSKYYALSVGGNYSTPSIRSAYEILLGAACAKTGLPNFYPRLKDKKTSVPDRLTR